MATARPCSRCARFDQFEVDLAAGELRKCGQRIALQDQPFQILRLLIEAAPEVVTREQIKSTLWPTDTFVDFDLAINTAVRKLRQALDDSVDHPKFIQTLAKRGYRFIGGVEWVQQAPQPEPIVPEPPWWLRRVTIAVAGAVVVAGSLFSLVKPQIERFLRLYELQRLTVVPLTTLPGSAWSPTFSPDGSQLAFAWDGNSNGPLDVYVKVIGSDRSLRLTHGRAGRPAWSPDGRNIAFWRYIPPDSGLYLISPLGGPERKLASAACDCVADSRISWSADGRHIAFLDHPDNPGTVPLLGLDVATRLFVLSLDSMERVPIKTGCNSVQTPAFSPRGDYLAWACADNESSVSIWLQRLNDGSLVQLLKAADGIGGLAWSRDGRRIVFSTSYRGTEGGDLWEISLTRPNQPEKLPFGHDASDIAVSPAGNGLAFKQDRVNVNIWRVNLSESQPNARKVVGSTRQETAPNISPAGDQIAFESTRSGSNEVWVSNSDGSNAVQLTSFGIRTTGSPHWSPDGKLIAFDSRAGGEANIYIVDPHGGVPRKLSIDVRGNSFPTWSHDGNWIYFINGDDAHNGEVWKVPSKGGHAMQIAKRGALFPSESTDGHYVYFSRDWRIWRVGTDGTGEQQIQGMPQLASSEAWSPFGSGIYFLGYGDNDVEIDFFDVDSHKVQRVFVLEKSPGWMGGGLAVSRDGKWLLFPQVDEASSDLMMIENWR